MKNKLVAVGMGASGLATLLAVAGTFWFHDKMTGGEFITGGHLLSSAFFVGLFAIMSFVGSRLWKE